jgi:hypothetical protein
LGKRRGSVRFSVVGAVSIIAELALCCRGYGMASVRD